MGARAVLITAGSGVLVAAGAMLTLPAPVAPPAAPVVVAAVSVPVPAVDTADRAAVVALWRTTMAPALAIPIAWTGSVSGCVVGAPAPAAQEATRTAVNVARRLVGEDPVTFDTTLSAKAQQAALVFRAQQDLSHTIPAGWACATAGAREAAARSDIALFADSGGAGAHAVLAYLGEAGGSRSTSLSAALHRRLLLDPSATTMGSGSTDSSNALWARGPANANATRPDWVPWPSAGWFPSPLLPADRWSLSAPNADFGHAHVVVRSATGKALPVVQETVVGGAGLPTLVWRVRGVLAPTDGHARSYHVQVTGIRLRGRTVSHGWTVRLVDPNALTPEDGTRITRSKGLLTVRPAAFLPAATGVSARWTRDGVPIRGALGLTYRPTGADAGHRIAAVVIGVRHGWTEATETASVHL